MIPGMNPKHMAQAMKKLGIKQQEIDATVVIIKTKDKELIINNPQVTKVNMMGQDTYQIIGQVQEKQVQSFEINKEDIQTVTEQTGVSEEQATTALEQHKGDIAGAILELQK
jgi:nascent polypeptide-associated complex subunit alpha